MNAKQSSEQEARQCLSKMVKPGDTVYTILRHVSRSGMTRVIDLVLMPERGTEETGPISISGWASQLLDMPLDRNRWGVKIGGCGMDMGFALVYDLSYRLFKDGFECIGEDCPANDHNNGDRDYTPHKHSDPGYALSQRWL